MSPACKVLRTLHPCDTHLLPSQRPEWRLSKDQTQTDNHFYLVYKQKVVSCLWSFFRAVAPNGTLTYATKFYISTHVLVFLFKTKISAALCWWKEFLHLKNWNYYVDHFTPAWSWNRPAQWNESLFIDCIKTSSQVSSEADWAEEVFQERTMEETRSTSAWVHFRLSLRE